MSTHGAHGSALVGRADAQIADRRRVEALLSAGIPAEEVRVTRVGQFVCTVCPHQPVLETMVMLATHRGGRKHREFADARARRTVASVAESSGAALVSRDVHAASPSFEGPAAPTAPAAPCVAVGAARVAAVALPADEAEPPLLVEVRRAIAAATRGS